VPLISVARSSRGDVEIGRKGIHAFDERRLTVEVGGVAFQHASIETNSVKWRKEFCCRELETAPISTTIKCSESSAWRRDYTLTYLSLSQK